MLHDCGALARIFPELDALYGVPQPPQWHPEIDTGLHIELVLQAAAGLTPEPRIRFAALMHDLGKGTTPRSVLPRHIGHEQRGVPLVRAIAERLRVPADYRELAVLASLWHGHVHRAVELRPRTILKMLEGCDAFRRPERFRELLVACEADYRGRGGLAPPAVSAGGTAAAGAGCRARRSRSTRRGARRTRRRARSANGCGGAGWRRCAPPAQAKTQTISAASAKR